MNRCAVFAIATAWSTVAGAQGLPPHCNDKSGPGPAGSDTLSPRAVAESLKVFAAIDKALDARPNDGTLWYRRAMIAWAISGSPQERNAYHLAETTKYRNYADNAFQEATRLAPDSITYLISTGRYYLSSYYTVTRANSYNYFNTALEVARKTGDRAKIAEVAIDVGRIAWREFDVFADRAGIAGAGSPDSWGEMAFLRAQAYFREAYEAAPNDLRMYQHYSMLLGAGERWAELEALARDRLDRLPNDGWGWMVVGLALQRMHKTDHAKAVFDTALSRLPAAERARLDRFERVLRQRDAARLSHADSATRAQTEAAAWELAKPLWMQKDLDPRVEFLARVTYAELRWAVPERGARGADTDKGNVYVRYGPPNQRIASGAADALRGMGASVSGADVIALNATIAANKASADGATLQQTLGGAAAVPTSTWSTAAGRFGFSGLFGNQCFRDSATALAQIEAKPSSFDNITDFRIDSLPIQVARFRSGVDSVDVFIAAEAPLARMRSAGATNTAFRGDFWLYGLNDPSAVRDSVALVASGAMRWTPRVPAGRYYYRIEAGSDGIRIASRAASNVVIGTDSITGFAMRGFGISDLLLATRATPRAVARRWSDIDVAPVLAGLTPAGELSLVWETYELGRNGNSARYRVSISLQREVSGPTPVGRVAAQIVNGIAGAIGVSRREARTGVTFEFERELPYSPTLVDNVTLSLGGTPTGSYRLTLSVTDRTTGRITSRTTRIVIREPSPPPR